MEQDKTVQVQRKTKTFIKPKKKSRLFFILIIIAVILALIFFSTRLYLAVNLLLGNDIVVKLSSDKENINLQHGQSENIKFNSYILTNPLCNAECISEFNDLSNDQLIDKDNFTLKPTIAKSKEYIITAAKLGKGQNLYRFDLTCKGISTFWCHTSEQERKRSILITLNYDLNEEEKEFKDISKKEIEKLIQNSDALLSDLGIIDLNLQNISSLDTNYFYIASENLKNEISAVNDSAYNLKTFWENREYEKLSGVDDAKSNLGLLEIRFGSINSSFAENISEYNGLIDNLSVLKTKLERLRKINVTNESLLKINGAIKSFNDKIELFNKKSSIDKKSEIVKNISSELSNLSIINEENATIMSDEIIKEIPEKIQLSLAYSNLTEIGFNEPKSSCCLFKKCSECCDSCSGTNYPVLLVHGHAFNKKISAEYSLETFQAIQDNLEKDGYLNAGSVLISSKEQKGVWSSINSQLTVKASYYFDIYKNPKESSIIETKSDSLDSYALRLRDAINIVKYKTGKEKVIIVAHSMGGLVIRKYIQIFGGSDIEKLILISVPNNGIEPDIQKFCSLIGETLECRDMAKDSLFINKLSYAELPEIPIYNIIGTGCKMGNETGDGIVTKSSAYLDGAKNYEVQGACDELKFSFLHEEILYPGKYPEVYKEIVNALKE